LIGTHGTRSADLGDQRAAFEPDSLLVLLGCKGRSPLAKGPIEEKTCYEEGDRPYNDQDLLIHV
jgi:hypothetical protein